jgi:hypothetical protein
MDEREERERWVEVWVAFGVPEEDARACEDGAGREPVPGVYTVSEVCSMFGLSHWMYDFSNGGAA